MLMLKNIHKNASCGKKGWEFWGWLLSFFLKKKCEKNVAKTTFSWRTRNDGGT
jgi:hypothetical protein